jgi:hypothetical protein
MHLFQRNRFAGRESPVEEVDLLEEGRDLFHASATYNVHARRFYSETNPEAVQCPCDTPMA